MAQIRYAGEVFDGYNKPKRTPGDSKKSAVLVDCRNKGPRRKKHEMHGDRSR